MCFSHQCRKQTRQTKRRTVHAFGNCTGSNYPPGNYSNICLRNTLFISSVLIKMFSGWFLAIFNLKLYITHWLSKLSTVNEWLANYTTIVNVNVNVEVYSLISPRVQQTLQFTPLVWELSPIWSHLLWGEFSAFSAAKAIHNFSSFRSTRYQSLLGGQRQYGMGGFAQHLYTWINYSDLMGTG